MLANLYVVGAPKAGTTSLCDWLAQHRDVSWSVPKEPYFWASDFPGMRGHYGFATQPAYEALYSSPEAASARYRGDGSTTYLYSRVAVPAIEAAVPEARYLVCVRDPVALVRSWHRTQLTAMNQPEPDLRAAWTRSLSGAPVPGKPLDPMLLDYQLVGAQGVRLGALLDVVPRERVEVLVFDDLAAHPEQVWRDTCGFLDLDPDPLPSFTQRNASNKAARSGVLRQLTHRPPAFLAPTMARVRQWSRTSDSAVVRRFKQWQWVPAERPEVDPGFDSEVRSYFADDVARLTSLLDRDLTALWAADEVPQS